MSDFFYIVGQGIDERSTTYNTIQYNYVFFRLSADLTDFRYRTKLPEGVSRKTGESLPSDTSDSDSSLETTTTVNTEDLQNMLRSHSTIIKVCRTCNCVYMLLKKPK